METNDTTIGVNLIFTIAGIFAVQHYSVFLLFFRRTTLTFGILHFFVCYSIKMQFSIE